MLRFCAGSGDAFAELVRSHQHALLNLFRRLGADVHSAEDCAQETFVRLYRVREKYRPSAPFASFLYTLARNSWIDYVRARGKWRVSTPDDELFTTGGDGAWDDRLDLLEAVARLPEATRWVLVLSLQQGLNYAEIADVLDVPLGTVKSRMFYAVRRLREALHARVEI
ncbi:MAG: RNA polymerase sigma factor [Planctomycetota bacterium]